jgi:Leucine rich repeat
MLFFSFLLIALSMNYSHSVILECSYSDRGWVTYPTTVYSCFARVLTLGNDSKRVEGVTQNHLPGRSNNDVQAIAFYNQSMSFIPQNIEKYFGNIKIFHVKYTTLKTVSKEDLKPFPQLELVAYDVNQLEEVEGDLFDYNPKLHYIDLSYNKITNVGPNILRDLKGLTTVYFSKNLCLDRASLTSLDIEAVSREFTHQCPPSARMIEEIVLNGDKFEHKVDAQVSERINPVVYRVNQNEIDQQATNEELKARIVELEKIVRELTDNKS